MKRKLLPQFEEVKELLNNVICISEYNLDIEDANFILKTFYDFCFSHCNYFIDSKSSRETKAILGANINYQANEPKIEKHNFKSQKAIDVATLQSRIAKIINSNKLDGVELVIFSSKLLGQGTILMQEFQKYLLKLNINKFYLFTDVKCNYQWYIKNKFKLEKLIPVKINDLKTIKDYLKNDYNVMIFSKEII